MNLYWAQSKFPIQKLAVFRKIKKINPLCGVLQLLRTQVILQIDPRINGFCISQGRRRDLSASGGLGEKTISGWKLNNLIK